MTLLDELATRLGHALKERGLNLTTAESCTGGWVAKAITDIPGSSGWFERGFITYSNAAKTDLLDVQETTLNAYGAVSGETVTEMAEGALRHSQADIAVAVSGIAGPDGGTPDKPVGTVWVAWVSKGENALSRCYAFKGNREAIRYQSVVASLEGVLRMLDTFQCR